MVVRVLHYTWSSILFEGRLKEGKGAYYKTWVVTTKKDHIDNKQKKEIEYLNILH